MRVLLLAVGRSRDEPVAVLVRRYAARLPWPFREQEVEARTRDPARRRAEEGALLLAALPPKDCAVIALDEHGQQPDSEAFAARLGGWRDAGIRHLAILIGGADGHAREVLARADWQVSFGRLTWPHELVRVLAVEQVYRATTILAGHPYHRG